MPKLPVVVGLDIGTNSIKALAATKEDDSNDFQVLAQCQKNAFGIRHGVINDVENVSKNIRAVMNEINQQVGREIESVYVNINGSHLFSTLSHGLISVSRADGNISQEDIDRVIQEAQTFSLPSKNREIFDFYTKDFIVDGESGIKNALGLKGVRLEVEIFALGAFSLYLKYLTQAILGANLDISQIVASPIACASSILSPSQKELGVAVLDIGAGTTSLTVFEEGKIMSLKVFPIGSDNITYDINIGLQTDVEIAERIKIEQGSCIVEKDKKKSTSRLSKDKEKNNDKDKIEIPEEDLVFSKKYLNKIIEARVSEIFDQVKKELKAIDREKSLPAGIILTGGGSKLNGILELAKKSFSLPVKIKGPSNFLSLKDNLLWPTACGLVSKGFEAEEESSAIHKIGIIQKLKKIFKIFVP